jgi:hypothetical protein
MVSKLRIKYVLITQYIKIAAIALVALSLCTVLLVTNVATPAIAVSPLAEDSQPEPESTVHRAGVSQEATVTTTERTDAFTDGTTLEDRAAFPLQNASAPVVTASGDGQATILKTVEIRMRYDAFLPGDTESAFYTKEEPIAIKEVNGTAGTVETTVNISDVFETRTELEEEFGNAVIVIPTIESVVTYQYTSTAGEPRTNTVAFGGEIVPIGKLYSLPTGTEQQRHETGQPAADPSTTDLTSATVANTAIGATGAGFILLLVTSIVVARRNGRIKLAQRIETNRHDEWVTKIESYTRSDQTHTVEVQTLAGLVNLAIDINERVLYTVDLDEYIVIDDTTVYEYRLEDAETDQRQVRDGESHAGPDVSEPDAARRSSRSSPEENTPSGPAESNGENGSDSDADGDE